MMKSTIKRILKESLSDDPSTYELCRHFKEDSQVELCIKLNSLKGWLHKDSGLGLKSIINDKLSPLKKVVDILEKSQLPLSILHDTGRYSDIKNTKGKFTHNAITNFGLVYDEEDNWHHVNKLNTNYSDLSELLTELLIRGGMVDKINAKGQLGIRKYLLSIKDRLSDTLDKYFNTDEYISFIRNTQRTSKVGEKAENEVLGVLTNFGMEKVYQGGDGDFIDMVFGVDLIMKHKGKIYTIQVKNTEYTLEKAIGDYRYRRINYLASPVENGVILYNNKGDSFIITTDGKIIR